MDHRIVDLHVHSTESDGTLTPEDLVAEAKKVGLAAFALTDHDTCQGVCKAMPCAASAGIELIPGIELSTDYHGKEVHIVGLYIDMENELFGRHAYEKEELIDNIEDCINKDFALLPDDEKNHNHYFEYIDDKNSERTYIYLKSKGY